MKGKKWRFVLTSSQKSDLFKDFRGTYNKTIFINLGKGNNKNYILYN